MHIKNGQQLAIRHENIWAQLILRVLISKDKFWAHRWRPPARRPRSVPTQSATRLILTKQPAGYSQPVHQLVLLT
jgi:hypothetical protein